MLKRFGLVRPSRFSELPKPLAFPMWMGPYQTEYINRFGEYEIQKDQIATSMEPALSISFLSDVMTSAGF